MDVAAKAQSVTAPDLAALVVRVAAGERQAEVELVDCFRRGVAVLARRHCRPLDPAADDIAQDVLVAMLERVRAGAIKEPAALPTYLRTAVIHAAAARYRPRREQALDGPDRIGERLADERADPAASLAARQLAAAIATLLGELTVPRDRELLRRFYLLEHDRDEVCAALGIDPGHFHRVIHRARQRFGEILARHGLGTGPG